MRIQTTIWDLASAICDEAVAMVGEGEDAVQLANATLMGLILESERSSAQASDQRARFVPRRRPERRLAAHA